MPNPAETLYTFRRPYTAVYVRGRANTATLPVYRDGALVAPSSGTYTLLDPSDTAIVSAAAVTISGSIAQYGLTSGHLPSTGSAPALLSPAYLETWSLVLPDGTTREWSTEVIVARRHLYPVVSDVDLQALYPDVVTALAQGVSTAQGPLDEAWRQIIGELIAHGRWPHRVMNPDALRAPHMHLALAIIFGAAASRSASRGNYLELASHHQDQASASMDRVRLALDNDEDGRTDEPTRRASVGGAVHVNANPSRVRLDYSPARYG